MSASSGLPDGFRIRLHPEVCLLDDGRTLVGGSPLRMLKLSERARVALDGGEVLVVDDASRQVADRLLAGNLAVPVLTVPGDPAELTVVVPVRDRAARLDRLLGALGPDLRVIVVDDASRDPAAVARVVAARGARLVPLTTNLGPAGARNAGLRRVTTPYVAFVDSDVVVDAPTLLGLAGHFTDPGTAAVAPRVRGADPGPGAARYERWDARWLSLDLGAEPGLVRPWSRVGYVPSACLLARVSDLGSGFEESLRVGEDVDLVWRLDGAGRRVRYDPSWGAVHDSRSAWRPWLHRRFVYGTSGGPLARRHRDRVAPAVLSPALAVAALAAVAQRRWSVPVVLAGLALARHRLVTVLPRTPGGAEVARALTAQSGTGTARQVALLALRHWWPAAAALSLVSPRARRVVAASLVWDLVDHREGDVATTFDAFAARRADDLAYGAGLWWGALRERSPAALLPHLTGLGRPRRAGRAARRSGG